MHSRIRTHRKSVYLLDEMFKAKTNLDQFISLIIILLYVWCTIGDKFMNSLIEIEPLGGLSGQTVRHTIERPIKTKAWYSKVMDVCEMIWKQYSSRS